MNPRTKPVKRPTIGAGEWGDIGTKKRRNSNRAAHYGKFLSKKQCIQSGIAVF
jgi:hypothetical protein